MSCTRAEHVAEELRGRVDLILDGGECRYGLESTIIDVSGGAAGDFAAGRGDGGANCGGAWRFGCGAGSVSPRVSGSLLSHYAPRAVVEIVASDQLLPRAEQLAAEEKKSPCSAASGCR